MLNGQTLDRAGELRAQGKTWRAVADALGVNHNTLKRDYNDRSREREQADRAARRAGVSVTDDGVRVAHAHHAATVEDVARESGLDLSEWRCTKINGKPYQGYMRDGDGAPVVVNLWSRSFTFERLPPWVSRGPIEPGVVIPPPVPRPEAADAETVLLVPDMQVGLRRPLCDPRAPRPALEPSHHRAGVELMLAAVRAIKPDRVVFLGDDLDAEEWSTYGHGLEADGMTDAALYELHFIYQQARLAAPHARIDCLQGNHGYRIEREIRARLKAASQLRRVGDTRPVWALASLLGLDALHIDYHGPYGSLDADLWLWRDDPRLRTLITHGRVTGKAGQVVGKLLASLSHSHWQGHDHTAQLASKTLHDVRPSRGITAASPGMLCRRDGAVPSTRRGGEDWTSGLGIIRRVGSRAFHSLLPLELDDAGRAAACWVGGRLLTTTADAYEARLHAEYPGFGYLGA